MNQDHHNQRTFLDRLAELEQQHQLGNATNPTSAALPAWRRLIVETSGRWVTSPLDDQHGDLATGYTYLFPSSAIEPSVWMTTASFGNEFEDRLGRNEQEKVTLHLRGWQARRLAMQLLTMAEHFDPGGTFDPEDEDA